MLGGVSCEEKLRVTIRLLHPWVMNDDYENVDGCIKGHVLLISTTSRAVSSYHSVITIMNTAAKVFEKPEA
jgi:hypothetical protein